MIVKEFMKFWFEETDEKKLFTKDKEFDNLLKEKYNKIHKSCAKSECFEWRKTASGSLVEIIILDQLSRNMHRDTPKAFSNDAMALTLAQEAISKNFHKELKTSTQKMFMFLPFMHSESKKIQEISIELYKSLELPDTLKYAILHKNIIDRFGRYPHRNKILNRETTKEEEAFLLEENSSF